MNNYNKTDDHKLLARRVSITLGLIFWVAVQVFPLALSSTSLLLASLPFCLISIALLSLSSDAYRNGDYVLAGYFYLSFMLSVSMGVA